MDNQSLNIDVKLSELVESSKAENASTLQALKGRFFNELLISMIFFIFSRWSEKEGSEFGFGNTLDEESPAERFFNAWKKESSKKISKEIKEINKKLHSETFQYLGAISNYSLPSTEDYQFIYTEALKETKKMFEAATKQR